MLCHFQGLSVSPNQLHYLTHHFKMVSSYHCVDPYQKYPLECLVKNFWLYYRLKMLTISLETHDGLTLAWESNNWTIYYPNCLVIVLYLEWPLIYFSVHFVIRHYFNLTPPPPTHQIACSLAAKSCSLN